MWTLTRTGQWEVTSSGKLRWSVRLDVLTTASWTIHALSMSFLGRALVELKVAHSRMTFMNIHKQSSRPSFTSESKLFLFPYFHGRGIENDIARTNTH